MKKKLKTNKKIDEEIPTISEETYNKIISQMKYCPYCGSQDGDIFVVDFHHWVCACRICDARGPVTVSAETALKRWNQRSS